MTINKTCKKCNESKEESLFVQIKGKRVGMTCRVCRTNQILLSRKNKEQIKKQKEEKSILLLEQSAICSKCNNKKHDLLFPQQFGKIWGSVCLCCTSELKKKWHNKSSRGIEIAKRKQELQEKIRVREEEKQKRIYERSIACLIDNKTICLTCNIEKQNIDFPVNKIGKRHGRKCLSCTAESTRQYNEKIFNEQPEIFRAKKAYASSKRRAGIHCRIPKWANMKVIEQIYANRPKGYHVDHVIPLFGKFVSGLHVETNMQYLPEMENFKKNNKFSI
jgi:hypothetical protein